VLVIDDDEDFRILAWRLLSTAGFKVGTASGVAEGLEYMRTHPIGLVILDILMPGRDGMEGTADIGRLFPEAKIVTVSGAANSERYLKLSARLGATASLDKRNVGSLCALLEVVLDH